MFLLILLNKKAPNPWGENEALNQTNQNLKLLFWLPSPTRIWC